MKVHFYICYNAKDLYFCEKMLNRQFTVVIEILFQII